MKGKDLIKLLERNGCQFVREGKRHTLYLNLISGKTSAIPRHVEVKRFTAESICKDLGVDFPK